MIVLSFTIRLALGWKWRPMMACSISCIDRGADFWAATSRVWSAVMVSRHNPLLLPQISPLSQSVELVHLSVLFSHCSLLSSDSCSLLHLRWCPLWGFLLNRHFSISVRGKWSWQADLGWLTLLTWLFVQWVHLKKVIFWVIYSDCIYFPLALSFSLSLFVSVSLLAVDVLGITQLSSETRNSPGKSRLTIKAESGPINIHYILLCTASRKYNKAQLSHSQSCIQSKVWQRFLQR